jgi:hypothetical protein
LSAQTFYHNPEKKEIPANSGFSWDEGKNHVEESYRILEKNK